MASGSTTGGGAVLEQRRVAQKVAVTMVGLALVAGACRTDREVTRPEPVPVTAERVEAALLTADDLPASFTAADDATPIDTEVVPEHECDDAIADLDPKESASADFTSSDMRLTSTVAWFPGGGGAVDNLYRTVAAACAEAVVPEDGLSVRARGLDFGVLSDDTLALEFEVEPASGAIQERDLIIMREGDLLSIVRLTGPRPSDKVLLDAVVRVAIGRLGFLAQETTGS
jgi:hypothetical protein